jgi:hypothetical protein
LIRGEDGTPHFVIRTVHKKGKPKKPEILTALLINSIIKGKKVVKKMKIVETVNSVLNHNSSSFCPLML